jgi:hypothetical protein
VITELDAADLALCEFEDARRAPCITASAWGETDLVRVPRGGIEPHKLVERGATPRPATNFPADVSEPAVGVLCVWCLIERAYQAKGHGPAPRTPRGGFVRTGSCARHSEPATLSREVVTVSPTVRRASAPAAERAPDGTPNPNASVLPAFPRGRWS